MFGRSKAPPPPPPPKRTTPLQGFMQILNFLFLSANTTILVIIIISGAISNPAIDNLYWMKSDTSGISGAPDVTKWTFWGIKSQDSDSETLFYGSSMGPAYPISPVDNFHTTANIPHGCIKHRNSIFYMSRCAFAFFWMSLSFTGIGNLIYFCTLCSYEFAKSSLFLILMGTICNILAVCLGCAAPVIANRAFHHAGRQSVIGAGMFGISWTSALLSLFVAGFTIWQFFHTRSQRKKRARNYRFTDNRTAFNFALPTEKNNKNYYNSPQSNDPRNSNISYAQSTNSTPPPYSEKRKSFSGWSVFNSDKKDKKSPRVSVYSMRDSASLLDEPQTPAPSLQSKRHGFKNMKFFKMRRKHHGMTDDHYNF